MSNRVLTRVSQVLLALFRWVTGRGPDKPAQPAQQQRPAPPAREFPFTMQPVSRRMRTPTRVVPIDPRELTARSRAVVEGARVPWVTRNSRCPCGSGLRFKRCCMELRPTETRPAVQVTGRA